jgi:PAS domain S-box-containing protein
MSRLVGSMSGEVGERDREIELEADLALISGAQAIIAFTPDGTILNANANFLHMMGYARDELVGRNYAMFLQPGENESLAHQIFWSELLQGACTSALSKRLARDAREVWLQATYTTVLDSDGCPVKIVKFCSDVTATCMEAANSAGQLHAINRAQAVIEFALDGTILTANENFLQAMGYALHEIVGKPHAMFVEPDELDSAAQRAFWAALRGGEFRDGEFRRIGKHGRDVWLRASYNPIFDLNGKPCKVVAFATDVTPQVMIREQFRVANTDLARMARHYARAKNAAEEASRAKTRFLAGMSHELRTPLNGILGYAQLLHMEGGLTRLQATRIQAMMDAGNHLLEMISCVLDLSEIESGDAGLRAGPMDIVGLAEASLAIVRAAAQKKGLELCLQIAPDVPRKVTADTGKTRQVLLNVLGNAVKYTQRGGVELRIDTVAATATPPAFTVGEPRLRFIVADTGPGIPPDRRSRLFEEFDRLGAASSTATEGAGLGLSLSKRLAMLMGGTLDYQDNPDGGSIFVLDVPLIEAGASASSSPAIAKDPPKGRDARILVVDDVSMNRDIAAAFLTSAGYLVVCAESGEKGVQEAGANDFLAVLMDVRMPGMDGLEATRRIRTLGGTRGTVPVVALTAQVFTEQIAACRAAGMDTHVGKPFTLENLLGAVTRVVEERLSGAPVPMPDLPDMKAPPAPVLPVLDHITLERTAALLNGSSVRSFLDTLTVRAEELRRNLGARDGMSAIDDSLANAAHRIAGSAGMFGFDRLAHVAKHFEDAVKAHSPDAEALADDLDSALDASLAAMRGIEGMVMAAR